MTIWLILILTTLVSTYTAVMAGANEHVYRAARVAAKTSRQSTTLTIVNMLAACGIAACWTVYAFEVGDWRFAAITWVPIVTNVMLRAVMPKYGEGK